MQNEIETLEILAQMLRSRPNLGRVVDLLKRFTDEHGRLKPGVQSLLDQVSPMLEIAQLGRGDVLQQVITILRILKDVRDPRIILENVTQLLPDIISEDKAAHLQQAWEQFVRETRHRYARRLVSAGLIEVPPHDDNRNHQLKSSWTEGPMITTDDQYCDMLGIPSIPDPVDLWGEHHGFTHLYLVNPQSPFQQLAATAQIGFYTGEDLMGSSAHFDPLSNEDRFPARSGLTPATDPYWIFVRFIETHPHDTPQSLQRSLNPYETGLTLREGMFLYFDATAASLLKEKPDSLEVLKETATSYPFLLLEAWDKAACLVLTGEGPPAHSSCENFPVGYDTVPKDSPIPEPGTCLVPVRGIYRTE